MIEAIIALAVAIFIITAVVVVITSSLSGSTSNTRQDKATAYAQEGIEVLRDIKTADFISFTAVYPSGSYCLTEIVSNPTISGADQCDGDGEYNILGSFIRRIYINHAGIDTRVSPNVAKCDSGSFAASTVLWTDSKCRTGNVNCHDVEISTCFENLNSLPAL